MEENETIIDVYRPPSATGHNEKYVQIVCSPQMKYVATITHMDAAKSDPQKNGDPTQSTHVDEEDQLFKEATLWSVSKKKSDESDEFEELALKRENTIKGHQITEPRPSLWAVSDNMYIVFKTTYFYYNFEVFDGKEGVRKELYFPSTHNVVNQLAFIKNGDLVIALIEPVHCIYTFKLDQYNEWVYFSKFEVTYFYEAFITIEGKLILFDDKIFQLTKWDISELSFETNCLIDWCYKVKHVEINKGGEFLAVHAAYVQGENETTKKSRIYVFSLKSGMNMAF
ncbi:34426_t:CDS:2, partial [Racocetra persica]